MADTNGQKHALEDVIYKHCNACHKEKVLSGDNFHRDASNPDGYRDVCKDCRMHQDETDFALKVQEQIEQLDRSSLMLLQKVAEDGSSSAALPHAATLLEDMMSVWGGSRGFACHVLKEYLKAPQGGQIRLKYLNMVLTLVKFVSQEGYAVPPLTAMDEDKLMELKEKHEKELRARLKEVMAEDGQTVTDD